MSNIDELFKTSFLKGVEEKIKSQKIVSDDVRRISEGKLKKLTNIRAFLTKIADMKVVVNHSEFYSLARIHAVSPVVFSFCLGDSSTAYAPGVSIFIAHPAAIEIAIPNDVIHGRFRVSVTSHHPDSFMIDGWHQSDDDVCDALGKFLAKNAIVGSDSKLPVTEVAQTNTPRTAKQEKVQIGGKIGVILGE